MRDYILSCFFDASSETFSHRFATRFKHVHINVKKMLVVLFALRKWLNILKKTHLYFYDDNFVVIFDFQKRFINDSVMSSLRDICMFLVRHDIVVNLIWIFTKNNVLVDMLSRFQHDKIVDIYSQLRYQRFKCEILFQVDTIKLIWANQHLYFFNENSHQKLVRATISLSEVTWSISCCIIVVSLFRQ